MKLAFVRHGPTEWNALGKIQGRTDIPLSEEGRARMGLLLPPEGFEKVRVFSSPLIRATETAKLLGLADPVLDERLSEHHWGDWEGLTRDEILARDGAEAFSSRGLGIDFIPKGGEATRAFVERVHNFIRHVATGEGDAIAVCHRGVMRSAYAVATGWDMMTGMPGDMDTATALVLDVERDGSAKIHKMNVALGRRA